MDQKYRANTYNLPLYSPFHTNIICPKEDFCKEQEEIREKEIV